MAVTKTTAKRSKKKTMTVADLWALPRIGAPSPSPDGTKVIVPVTRYSMETNQSTTQLWLVPADAERAGDARRNDPATQLTRDDATSSQVAWQPGGEAIAYVRKPGGEPGDSGAPATGTGVSKPGPKFSGAGQLYVQSMKGGEGRRVTDLPFGAASPRWFPDGKRIAFASLVYAEGPKLEATASLAKDVRDDPVRAHATERRFYRFWDSWHTDERVYHLFVLDIETGTIVDVTPKCTQMLSHMVPGFDIAPDGREIAFTAYRKPTDALLPGVFVVTIPPPSSKKTRIGTIREISEKKLGASAMAPIYSADGQWVIYELQKLAHFYADRRRLVAFNRKKKSTRVLTEGWDFSAGAISISSDSRTIFCLAEIDSRNAVWKLDLKAAWNDPAKNPPREVKRGGTFSSLKLGGKRIFCDMSSVSHPPEIISFQTSGQDVKWLTGFTRPILDQCIISQTEDVYFEGAEGDRVHMMLIYPPGVKKPRPGGKTTRKLPLVHMIHGGPHGVFGDQWHWRWCAQLFASPGYLCAMVNFHGSTSWGEDFTASILGRWGDQPYHDIMKATDYLIDRGLADPKRMAISGGSYGGYLVSWLASKTDRFSCIVNHAGVCDLQAQYGSDVVHGRAVAMGGEPWDNIEGMDRYNPMRYASGFKTPMLVVHGELDYRVPYIQGLEMYNVYKSMGLPARLVVYPDENHWILKPRNSRHWYGEVLGWFDRWIGRGRKK